MTVGANSFDDTAVLASSGSTIAWAEGSFPSVTGVTRNAPGASFSLQLNSQYIQYPNQNSSPCANGDSTCVGWAQFGYQAERGVWMEWWLAKYGYCPKGTLSSCDKRCPTGGPFGGWNSQVIPSGKWENYLGCYIDSTPTPVTPNLAETDLERVSLTGIAGPGGDSVMMTVGGTIYANTAATTSPVNLSSYWNTAEFNVFGFGNGELYPFEPNVSLGVQILTDSTTLQAPHCVDQSFTGESNNLTMVPNSCCTMAGGPGITPGIQFLESNSSPPPPLPGCPLFATDPNWTTVNHPFDAIIMGTDVGGGPLYSCRVNYGSGLQPGKTTGTWTDCDIGYGQLEYGLQPYQNLVAGWVDEDDGNGNVPWNALPLGKDDEGSTLYACRAYLNNNGSNSADSGLQVGKVRPGLGACDIPYGGTEVYVNNYQVLTSTLPLTTEGVGASTPPSGALVGGYDKDGTPLYVCVANFGNGIVPGKVDANWTSCDVPYGGSENYVSNYQVLVPSFKNPPGTIFNAGFDTDGKELGICKAYYQYESQVSTQVGRYRTETQTCNFGYSGSEVAVSSNYWVLSN